MNTYIFHRRSGWYPVELCNDTDAIVSVGLNPGTLKVERIDDDGMLIEIYSREYQLSKYTKTINGNTNQLHA